MADSVVIIQIGEVNVTSSIVVETLPSGFTQVRVTSATDSYSQDNLIMLPDSEGYLEAQFEYDVEVARFAFATEAAAGGPVWPSAEVPDPGGLTAVSSLAAANYIVTDGDPVTISAPRYSKPGE